MRIEFDHDTGSPLKVWRLLNVVCEYRPGRRRTPTDYGDVDEFDWTIIRVLDGGKVDFYDMSVLLQTRLVERVRLNANLILEEGSDPDDKLDR